MTNNGFRPAVTEVAWASAYLGRPLPAQLRGDMVNEAMRRAEVCGLASGPMPDADTHRRETRRARGILRRYLETAGECCPDIEPTPGSLPDAETRQRIMAWRLRHASAAAIEGRRCPGPPHPLDDQRERMSEQEIWTAYPVRNRYRLRRKEIDDHRLSLSVERFLEDEAVDFRRERDKRIRLLQARAITAGQDIGRVARAVDIVREDGVCLYETDAALVCSADGQTAYAVASDSACSCPDRPPVGLLCKHALAVIIERMLERM